jgi:cytoskeletal protein RodZ
MNRILIVLAAALLWSAAMFGAGWAWRGDRAERDQSQAQANETRAAVTASEVARQQEQRTSQAAQAAGDVADNREAQIDADYQERMAAALAGRDSELGRLRKEWAACATDRLSSGAAAAAEAAEQDRLRRASAARVLRATELAQSERDECVDRYTAITVRETHEDR